MVTIGYVDESIRRNDHLMALAVAPPSRAPEVDRRIRSMRLPGQGRIHMCDERVSRRRQLINAVVDLQVFVAIYVAPRPVFTARPMCLAAIAADAVDCGVDRLILDRGDERQTYRDRAALQAALIKTGVRYVHAPSREHPGLQLADIVAWAYGAGGDWRRRVLPMIDRVRHLSP